MQKAEDKLLANWTFFSFLTGVPKSLGYSTRFLMQSKVKLSMILAEDNMQERRRMGFSNQKLRNCLLWTAIDRFFCWKGETATIKEPGLDLKEKGRVRFTGSELVPYLLSLFQGVFFYLAENIPIKRTSEIFAYSQQCDMILSWVSFQFMPLTRTPVPNLISHQLYDRS